MPMHVSTKRTAMPAGVPGPTIILLIPREARTGRIRPDIAIKNAEPDSVPPNALVKRFKRLLDDSHLR
jgi:hypothetical protein